MPRGTRLVRTGHIALLVFVFMLVVVGRLFFLQVFQHKVHRLKSLRQVDTVVEVPARRGRILDRNGKALAFDVVAYDISILKKHFRSQDLTKLSLLLDLPRIELKGIIQRGGSYISVARQRSLSASTGKQLRQIPGLCVDRRNARQYPYGVLAAQYIGLLNSEGNGIAGVEQTFNDLLRGRPGTVRLLKDEDGNPLSCLDQEDSQDGSDVVLTLDIELQRIAEAQLKATLSQSGAHSGTIVIVDPENGDILACANGPGPPSRTGSFDPTKWRNRAVYDLFEPGSTLKVVTASAALRHGLVSLDTHIYAERGRKTFRRAGTIHDAHRGYKWLSLEDAFALSSNVCFAKLANRLQSEQLYQELRAFGFGTRSGVDFLKEPAGLLALPRKWTGHSPLRLGIGQAISVTSIQMAGLYSAIANGGRLLRPRVAMRVESSTGSATMKIDPMIVRRVLSEERSADIRQLCTAVVTDGTGKSASVQGIQVAGKTGTAEKVKDGHYVDEYVASFAGFVPAEQPRLVVIVTLDEPTEKFHYGSASAAPAFRGVVESVLRCTSYLQPTVDRMRIVRGDDLSDPSDSMKNPLRVVTWKKDALPDLRGFSLRTAASWLHQLGVPAEADGRGIVQRQWPKPGESLAPGETVHLVCGPQNKPVAHATIWPY